MRRPLLAAVIALGAVLAAVAGAAPPPRVLTRPPAAARRDATVHPAQAAPSEVPPAPASPPAPPVGPATARPEASAPGPDLPAAALPVPGAPGVTAPAGPVPGSQPLSLQSALYGAITGNPDLITLRQNAPATAEAVEVARLFPTALNPTIFLDLRPLTYTHGSPTPGYHQRDFWWYISLRQPIELGHQTRFREGIARAAYNQARWGVVQAEMLALVQTYRFYQTAAYRREKLRVAQQLADFTDRLVRSLRRREEENLAQAADVALAEVEARALRQQVDAAQQDYVNALTDLRNQIGTPETAAAAEPLGEFVLPPFLAEVDDQSLIETALQSRPEIHSARAAVAGARAAVGLAKGDAIPTPVVGPQYQSNENATQFIGFVYITPIPVLNSGRPLIRQREAECRRAVIALQQTQQRTVAQVRAAVAKWNGANRLVTQTVGLARQLETQVGRIERLFEENQADLSKLLQARQRLIQLENARLDAIWQATQAQADLLTALGAPALIAALHGPQPTAAAPTAAPQPPVAPAAGSPPR